MAPLSHKREHGGIAKISLPENTASKDLIQLSLNDCGLHVYFI